MASMPAMPLRSRCHRRCRRRRVSLPVPPAIVSAPAPPSSVLSAGVAGDRVGERVAGAVDRRPRRSVSGSRRWRQACSVTRRFARGRCPGRGFGDDVAGIVDDVGVVAGAADHGVRARAAVQDVVAGSCRSRHCCERVAGAIDRRAPVNVRFSTLAPRA